VTAHDIPKEREPTDEELLSLGDLLDGIDFAAHWDETTPVEAEYAPNRQSNLVVVPPDLMKKVRARARMLGKSTDAVVKECLRSGLAAR
jgi:hypothetical protein